MTSIPDNQIREDGTPKCPICGLSDDCDHLIAALDFQFGEIVGGVLWDNPVEQDLVAKIQSAFLAAHQAKPKQQAFSRDKHLMRLWRESKLTGDEDERQERGQSLPIFFHRGSRSGSSRAAARTVCSSRAMAFLNHSSASEMRPSWAQ